MNKIMKYVAFVVIILLVAGFVFKVLVRDRKGASIVFSGPEELLVYKDEVFVDPGFTVYDEKGWDVTRLARTQSDLDTSVPGTYTVVYSYQGKTPGETVSRERTIYVIEKPEFIKLMEQQHVYMNSNTEYLPVYLPDGLENVGARIRNFFTVGQFDADFTMIRDALASDKVADGSILIVKDPVHYESGIKIDKNVEIRGSQETLRNIIQANNPGEQRVDRIFDVIKGKTLILRNLTLRNGYARDGLREGGAVRTYGTLVALGCSFDSNQANCGGAIYGEIADIVILGCSFTNNYADGKAPIGKNCGSGAAVKIVDSCNLVICNSRIENNRADYKAGGVHVSCSSKTVILNTFFYGDVAQSRGGALFMGGDVWFYHNTVIGCEARGHMRSGPEGGVKDGDGIANKGTLRFANNLIISDKYRDDFGIYDKGVTVENRNNIVGDKSDQGEPVDSPLPEKDFVKVGKDGEPVFLMNPLVYDKADILQSMILRDINGNYRIRINDKNIFSADIGAFEIFENPGFFRRLLKMFGEFFRKF